MKQRGRACDRARLQPAQIGSPAPRVPLPPRLANKTTRVTTDDAEQTFQTADTARSLGAQGHEMTSDWTVLDWLVRDRIERERRAENPHLRSYTPEFDLASRLPTKVSLLADECHAKAFGCVTFATVPAERAAMLIARLVAGIAISRQRCLLHVPGLMACITACFGMLSRQAEFRCGVVIEFRAFPLANVVALAAIRSEAAVVAFLVLLRMTRRTCNRRISIEFRLMAIVALRIPMLPAQREARQRVIEFGVLLPAALAVA